MDSRTMIANTQDITPEHIDALVARAHGLRNEYIAHSVRRLAAAVRQRLGGSGAAPSGRLAGSH